MYIFILHTPSNILCISYLWCSWHPIGMALAPGRGELWSWTPLSYEDLAAVCRIFGVCRILGGVCRILDGVHKIFGETERCSSMVSIMMDECNSWWMSAMLWLQQSECLDECYSMISAEWNLLSFCQAKYDNFKCKTTDLLQAMTCIV